MAFGYDPQLSAFLRAMGVEEATIRAQARTTSDQARRQVERTEPLFDRRIEAESDTIRNESESRGMLFSGNTAKTLTESRTGIELERAERQAQLRDQLQAIQTDAATRVSSLRREATEGALAGRTRQTEAAAGAAYGRGGSFFR